MKNDLPTVPKELSRGLQDLIKSCMKYECTERPTAKELLNHPFYATSSNEIE